jgi:hypothetical protein
LDKLNTTAIEVERVRYPVNGLAATVVWTMPDEDPTLEPIHNSEFMLNVTSVLNRPDLGTQKFFQDLFKTLHVEVAVKAGSDEFSTTAAFGENGPGPEGLCGSNDDYCIYPAHHHKQIELRMRIPLRLITKPSIPTLFDFGGKAVLVKLGGFNVPKSLQVRELILRETASNLSLAIPQRSESGAAMATVLPKKLGVRIGGPGIYWR